MPTRTEVSWDQIEAQAGFRPLSTSRSELTRKEAAVLGPIETYFGSFGKGVDVAYQHGTSNQGLIFTQRRVDAAKEPFTFLYPPAVARASTTTVNGASGVVVVPLAQDAQLKPFIHWAPTGFWVSIRFFYDVTEATMVDVARSFR
jgi:hypothetical protein